MNKKAIYIKWDSQVLHLDDIYSHMTMPDIYTQVQSYKFVDEFILIQWWYTPKNDKDNRSQLIETLVPKRYVQTLMVFRDKTEMDIWLNKNS